VSPSAAKTTPPARNSVTTPTPRPRINRASDRIGSSPGRRSP